MSNPADYTPPRVWTWRRPGDGRYASIKRAVAGARHERTLQPYSLATPGGVKVMVMLETLLAAEQGAWHEAGDSDNLDRLPSSAVAGDSAC